MYNNYANRIRHKYDIVIEYQTTETIRPGFKLGSCYTRYYNILLLILLDYLSNQLKIHTETRSLQQF